MPAIPDPQTKGLLNVHEAAEVLGVNERTIYNMIDEGRFPIIRVGRGIRIRTDEFLAAFGLEPQFGSVEPLVPLSGAPVERGPG